MSEEIKSERFLAHQEALKKSLQAYRESPSKARAYLESMRALSEWLKGRKH